MIPNSNQGDYVITIHGLGRTWRSMRKPQKFFEKQGYRVFNFTYPSTLLRINSVMSC